MDAPACGRDGVIAGWLSIATRMRPIARAMGAHADPVVALQFMQTVAIVGELTILDGIRRRRTGTRRRADSVLNQKFVRQLPPEVDTLS